MAGKDGERSLVASRAGASGENVGQKRLPVDNPSEPIYYIGFDVFPLAAVQRPRPTWSAEQYEWTTQHTRSHNELRRRISRRRVPAGSRA